MQRIFGSKTVVGVEFDTGVVRGVELSNKHNRLTVTSYAQVEIPKGGIEEGQIINQEIVAQSLTELWSKGKFRTRDVVIGISNQGILIRFAYFPHVAPGRVDSLVHFQAQEHLPVPMESIELDYAVIGSNTDGERPQLELILVAGKKEMLQHFLQVLEMAKLNPLEIEVLPLSLLRLLKNTEKEKNIAIINIGRGVSNMLIADNLTPRLARMMPMNVAGVVPKSREGASKPQENIVAELTRNIRSTIGFYQSNRAVKPVEKILLSGIPSVVNKLSNDLKIDLGLLVEIVKPLEALQINSDHRSTIDFGEYSLALSLASRGWE